GKREASGLAFEVGKDSIAPFGFELSDLSAEKGIEIHCCRQPLKAEPTSILRECTLRRCGPPPQCRHEIQAAFSPCACTQDMASSSTGSQRRNSSSISASVMISGGQKAMLSPTARTRRPCACARA